MDAPERANQIKAFFTMILAFCTALWGWLGWAIILWAAAILADYITGSMAAKKEKNWSSEIAREGLWHKTGEIFAVLVAGMCDIAIPIILEGAKITLPFDIGPLFMPIVLLWYFLTEVGSILENCGRLGGKVPKWFKQRIENAIDAIDKDQEKPSSDGNVSELNTGETPSLEEILQEYKK